MDLPSKHVLDLSKRIGARGAGTDGESAAASYVLRAFSEFDIEVDVETFSTWKSDLPALAIICILAIVAYLVFRVDYTLSVVLAAIVWLLFQMETYSWGIISKLMPHSSATNVLGKVKPSEDPRQLVVLAANYDTAKGSPLGRPGIARAYRVLYIVAFTCVTLIGILSIFGLVASLLKLSRQAISITWAAFAPAPAFLFVAAFLILMGEFRGMYTAGANDNGSGVAVMLSAMSSLAEKPLEHTTVWGVATARGFAGGRGMVALLGRHRSSLKHAFIVNIDHVGRGGANVITREGPMLGFRASRKLRKIALMAADRSRSLQVKKGKCRVKKSDAMVATVRGYKAITIGGTRGGTYDGWHNEGDAYDRIQRASLDRAVKFVEILLDEIDSIAGEGKRATSRKVHEVEDSEREDLAKESPNLDDPKHSEREGRFS
jgi:Peptidase family M28